METLNDFLPLRRSLSRADFLRRHPHPFLIEKPLPVPGEKKTLEFSTLNVTDIKELYAAHVASTAGKESSPVRKLVKRESNAFDGMINVGRVATNDVILDFQAISKFHAYFSRDGATGACCLTDADSSNGTFVNGERLKAGERRMLAEGDEIDFSHQACFTYASPGGFHDLLGRQPG